MKWKIFLKKQLLNDIFAEKIYGKGLLEQIKENKMYKVLINKEITNETDSHSKKWNPKRSLPFSGDLVEFMKEWIMVICQKDVVHIHVPGSDDGGKLMELLMIKVDFKKYILDLHIIIRGESI